MIGLILAAGTNVAAAADACPAQPSYHAAFRIETAPGGPMTGLWYPTNGAESAYQYISGTSGSVALNGTPACGTFPLVVFSHGFGGCGIQTVFFTEELSRHGYIVAAPDHRDAGCSVAGSGSLQLVLPQQSFFDPQDWTDSTYADRKTDIENVLNWMTGGSSLASHVDADRIGGSGHSLGGYTILGVAGAWSSWADPRIKAALLFAPYANPFLSPDRLGNIKVPVMYQGAEGDIFITPFLQGSTGAYGLANDPKYFAELPGGSHFSWTNLTCGSLTVSACLQTEPAAQLIDTYAFAFLDCYLKGDSAPLSDLDGEGLAEWDSMGGLLVKRRPPPRRPGVPGAIERRCGVGLAAVPTITIPAALANRP